MAAHADEPIRLAVGELARFLGADVDDPAFLADPYRCLTPGIREKSVHRLPGGALAVLGYTACAEVLRDTRFGHGARELYGTTLLGLSARSILQLDAPGHTRLRGQVARHFTARRVRALAENVGYYSTALVREHAGRPGDFVADFAEPPAMSVISDVLGVPPEDRPAFHRDARLVVRGLDQQARAMDERAVAQARFRFVRFFRRRAQVRRQAGTRHRVPRDDLLDALSRRPDGSPADIRGLVTTCSLLLSAGYDTTVSLLSHAVAELGGAPSGQGWALARDPQTVGAVVEEVLRLHSSVQIAPRAAVRDAVLGGLSVARGTIVLPLLPAANRDPDIFDSLHTFRPRRYITPAVQGRSAARHLAFGAGAHFCLGAALARLTAHSALAVLAACPPRPRDAPRTYSEDVVVRSLRSLRSLPATWPHRPADRPPHPPAGGAAAYAGPSCPIPHAQRSVT
ncbi:cytochrome P450 [Streptomyces sp. NRRL F-5755]|uniref:cytochrome P450 n=1 Tax=Streptomyces sp. NRRL F-5755 TaxID=1519475 RepID=UPI0006B05973|nr:cytochrome P450 [Streptomyces sp. NRRL F-5755]